MKYVSKVKCSNDIKKDIEKAVLLIGGFPIKKGDVVLLKPNYVVDKPYPVSTSKDALKAVAELLYKNGAKKVIIGESSYSNTRKAMENQGAFAAAKETNSDAIVFDEENWQERQINEKTVHIPEVFEHVDKVVFLCNLKTHTDARFTASLKHSIGCIKLKERTDHSKMEFFVPEVASLFKPDLCIIDARKVFVTEGPSSGEIRDPNLILASKDRIALDVEGLKILKSYEADNLLEFEPWDFPTIKLAIKLGLGAKSEKDYEVREE